MKSKSRVCELCRREANLYCESDSAFLCWDCDATVHGANFLVARHVRRTVCCRCEGFDGNSVSGAGSRPIRPVCRSCGPEEDGSCSSLSSSSSECISTAESFTGMRKAGGSRSRTGRIGRTDRSGSVSEFSVGDGSKAAAVRETKGDVDAKAEGILVIWSRRLGFKSSCCVGFALHAFGICLRKFTALPFRVCLASSLWFAAKLCERRGVSTWQLKKLEACSGVPAKLILLAETKLSPFVKLHKSSQEEAEGWAECSDG
ncbi:B-box zinc finger protein 32-like [Magnolia sinica]|uniref:B-box zinc finger protein 32-like n=1 Tax=Magnolia sinica TaxID=86752 RepID=UPI0026582742|nr:B-box zinc finger protein 32-like [Magnolia sinica]